MGLGRTAGFLDILFTQSHIIGLGKKPRDFLGILFKVILWVQGELHDFWVFYLLKVILLVWGELRDFLGILLSHTHFG